MTNYPPGGNPPPDQPTEPGYGEAGPPGSGYGSPPDPGYAQPPGYEPPAGPGYGPSTGSGYGPPPGPGYGPPPGSGYDPSRAQAAQGSGQPSAWDTDYRQQAQPYQGQAGPGYAVEPSRGYGGGSHSQDYPVQLTVEYPERSSRVLAGLSIPYFLLRGLMLIPAWFVLFFVGIAAGVVVWISFWAVLFTGRYPPTFHAFVTGYVRWTTRCTCFLYGLTDKYPPFSLEP
jgi:hypothetical protein